MRDCEGQLALRLCVNPVLSFVVGPRTFLSTSQLMLPCSRGWLRSARVPRRVLLPSSDNQENSNGRVTFVTLPAHYLAPTIAEKKHFLRAGASCWNGAPSWRLGDDEGEVATGRNDRGVGDQPGGMRRTFGLLHRNSRSHGWALRRVERRILTAGRQLRHDQHRRKCSNRNLSDGRRCGRNPRRVCRHQPQENVHHAEFWRRFGGHE